MSIIRTEHLKYEYTRQPEEGEAPILDAALRDLSVRIEEGEFVAVLGSNGSGKSTFARQLNALLTPTEGCVWIGEWSTAEEDHLLDIRSRVGMVFQNPDNQMVATIVEEDVAFGPENLGVAPETIRQRVDWALETVGMSAQRKSAPHMLSGGQKQRVAIAGVIAMQPEIIVFDESTSMLDPVGRADVMAVARRLNRENGVTVIWITHFMDEAAQADRVIIMDAGECAAEGTPREVFSNGEALRRYGLETPDMTALSDLLREAGVPVPAGIMTVEEMEVELCRLK